MGNFKKESDNKNNQKQPLRVICADYSRLPIPYTTLQGKVSGKIEITITRKQLMEAKWLFSQAAAPKPSWLRQKFKIDQRRRKCLNTLLTEAQLDTVFCEKYEKTDEWYDLLHLLWHDINGAPTCK